MKKQSACLLLFSGSLFFLLSLLFFRGATEQETAPLRIGVADAYPPLSFVDTDGRPRGFDPEMASALCRSMQRTCTLIPLPMDVLLEEMRRGALDIIAGLGRTPERERYMLFSDSYYRTRGVYLGRGGESAIRACMAKKRLGVQSHTILAHFSRHYWAEFTELVLFPTFADVIENLCAGRVDVALVAGLPGYAFLQSERGRPFTLLEDDHADGEYEALVGSAYIGVRKDNPALLENVNRAIVSTRLNGDQSRIARTYFPFNIY